ncbi:MAG TPA: DNA starvation/stationary phase protection protein Dps [Candidatus Eisenbacteria bacterium]|nr:DNA starvation/stationary phase protection protein Dps [Candidatus Eisenbacteria bacterium]
MPTKTESTVRFSSGVDLSDDVKSKLIDLLNARLADTIDVKTQVKHAHWNVKGPQFHQLHLLFDDVAGHVDSAADLIAERAVQLGGVAHGTARIAAKTSSIPEYDLDAVDGPDHVKALVARLGKLANASREAIDEADKLDDKATSDIFTEIVRATDKDLWFLEAHLQA